MQLVGLRSSLAFLTLSQSVPASGALALLREAQWLTGHGLSSELPTQPSAEAAYTCLYFSPWGGGAFTEFLPESSALRLVFLEPPHLEILRSRAAAP